MLKKENKKQENNKLSVKKAPFWVWLLSLVPLLSSALYLLILSDAVPFIKAEMFHVSGIIVLVFAMLCWGACGALFAYYHADIKVAVVVAHAVPIICTLVYTVSLFFTGFEVSELSDVALFAGIGMGLFSYVDTFIYEFIDIGIFGLYLDLIFMIFTFIAGYTIGKSKRFKTK